MYRIANTPAAIDAALTRPQPVPDTELVWSAGTITTWDGANFQVLERRLDENGEPALDVDDDGVEWAAFVWNEAATGAAAKAYQDQNPDPDEVKLREAAARA